MHKLGAYERYEILSGEYAVRVRGTHFVVERNADALSVFVHEGRVEVSKNGEPVALLSPGEGYPKSAATGQTRPKARAIHDLSGFSLPRNALQLPAMQQLRAWIVDGAQVTAQGELAMRLPPGPNELQFEDLRGQLRSVEIDVSAPWTSLSSSALSKLLFPAAERTGYLPPERISQVIKGSLHSLRRCYEHALRQSPALEGKVTLAMRVAADGHVARAQAKGSNELPEPLAHCLAQQARGMVFPKPEGDGAVSFEVPLNLKAAR